jgi:hypothetical protein
LLRGSPDDVQAAAVRAIIDYGAGHDDDLRLSDEQVAEVERRTADRKFLSLTGNAQSSTLEWATT